MYKWKPRNKKAEKRWNQILAEQTSEDSEIFKEMYKDYSDGINTFNDDRKIVYMTDGMYLTKDGIVLHEEDAYILDF
jgi:hypothetical protein